MTTQPAPTGLEPADPSERGGTRVDGVDVLGALSPSRAGEFLSCPLLYRFRRIDKLPERPSPDAVRGTVVHKVLEDMFDLPPDERDFVRAAAMLSPVWDALRAEDPELENMFDDRGSIGGSQFLEWLDTCRAALATYFTLEDPRLLEPAERELYVETLTASRLLLRGYVDRLDVAPNGAIRVVDYKTGRAPREGREGAALFQLKFYGLAVWRMRGVIPKRLQLMYLGSAEVITYDPDERDLLATERKVEAIWRAITEARDTGEWRPSPSPLCRWCPHQSICPEFGGTPPPLPLSTEIEPGSLPK